MTKGRGFWLNIKRESDCPCLSSAGWDAKGNISPEISEKTGFKLLTPTLSFPCKIEVIIKLSTF